ncbi:hypothetical protein [Marinigracilibium pacificum]|uniref:Uncharacterized protein n=1 Tax=Marinigracilibium pacificum TaxID=2729599 RepID=A0A848IZ33_9BACT|nr:hypothetical protein [Marinigracilibium pacificum]NMM48896.1 hypothetical protein [Marinigracilibium pacificum]
MKKYYTLILMFFSCCLFCQENLTKKAQPIVEEGKLLYKSEMASWYGTDIFLENYKETTNIGGYFSYLVKDTTKCIFFSREENPKVIGTISFDSTYEISNAKLNFTERKFSNLENDLYQIRKIALIDLQSNEDGFYKFYQNTNPNIIPLINNQEKKVYILTGPKQSGVVIFGNDYLLRFNKNNELINKKQLHKNIIPIEYENLEESDIEGTMHNHLPDTGDFITATDICTLMLYEKFTNWKTHNVVSQKYLKIWNCEKDQLTVIPMSIVDKISEDQQKRKIKN